MCVGILLGPDDFEILSDDMMEETSLSSHSEKIKFSVIRLAKKSLNECVPLYLRFSKILSATEEK